MLTQILTKLLTHTSDQNHELRGGMWLNWRPPDKLIISRPEVPPSEQELNTTIRHLQALGYTTYARKMFAKENDKGITWYGWPIQIAKQDALL